MKKTEKRNPHIGSCVDEFFAEEGLLHEIEIVAIQRLFSPLPDAEIAQKSRPVDESSSEAN